MPNQDGGKQGGGSIQESMKNENCAERKNRKRQSKNVKNEENACFKVTKKDGERSEVRCGIFL